MNGLPIDINNDDNEHNNANSTKNHSVTFSHSNNSNNSNPSLKIGNKSKDAVFKLGGGRTSLTGFQFSEFGFMTTDNNKSFYVSFF